MLSLLTGGLSTTIPCICTDGVQPACLPGGVTTVELVLVTRVGMVTLIEQEEVGVVLTVWVELLDTTVWLMLGAIDGGRGFSGVN